MINFDIEAVNALNAHANRLTAALYQVNSILKSSSDSFSFEQYSALFKALKNKMPQDNPKFPSLTAEKTKQLGESLRYPIHVLHHATLFQQSAIRTLQLAGKVTRTFNLSWNYVFVQPIMNLLSNYVKITLFVNSIPDMSKIVVLYEYAYKKVAGCDIPILNCCSLNDSFVLTFKKVGRELQHLFEAIYPMFKSLVGTFQRVIGAGSSFDWSSLNISDNPQTTKPAQTFFKSDYLLLIDLNNIIDWFLSYALLNLTQISNDSQLLEVFRLISTQKQYIELHGDFTVSLKDVFDQQKKAVKANEFDLSGFEESQIRRGLNNRCFRRRRLAMALNECLNAVNADPSILGLKFPIVLSLLGFANFEIRSTLSAAQSSNDKNMFDNEFITLLSAIIRLSTFTIKSEETVRRFTVYNLREFDGPYLESIIRSFNIPQNEYNSLNKFIAALKSIDIEKYDSGTRYDLTGLYNQISKVMEKFNQFSKSHGILHLSPLFNLISCISFHVKLSIAPSKMVLESAPLQKYWAYLQSFKQMCSQHDHPNAFHIACLPAFSHYFTADTDTLAEYSMFKILAEKNINDSVSSIIAALGSWCKDYLRELNKLSKQEEAAVILEKLQTNDNKNDPKSSRKSKNKGHGDQLPSSLADYLVGTESSIENRSALNPIALKINLITKTMQMVHEMGVLNVFGGKTNVHELIIKALKNIIVKLLNDVKFCPPQEMQSNINNARIVLSVFMIAGYVSPSAAISDNINQLVNAPLTIADRYVYQGDGPLGPIMKVYQTYFQTYFTELIKYTTYSPVQKTFIPISINEKAKSKNQPAVQPPQPITLSWLKSLYGLIGMDGMVLIDISAAEAVKEVFEKLANATQLLIPADDKAKLIELPQAEEVLGFLCHSGAILKFRQLIREAIDFDPNVSDVKYSFMAKGISPAEDIVLQSRIGKSPMVSCFNNNSFPLVFSGLLSSTYWERAHYIVQQDGFNDNSHLISLVTDALTGASLNINKAFPYQNKLKRVIIQANVGIKNSQTTDKKNKTGMALLEMFLVIDQFVKNSYYSDYSMLESVVSYQYIRSIYTLLLRDLNLQ